MALDKGADLTRMAAELYYLREAAKAAGQPFLAYLIEMAAIEAERLGARLEVHGPGPRTFYAGGEAEKPGG